MNFYVRDEELALKKQADRIKQLESQLSEAKKDQARYQWLRQQYWHSRPRAQWMIPTESQILAATEKAGLWHNTVYTWLPAFHRYHAELAKLPHQHQRESKP